MIDKLCPILAAGALFLLCLSNVGAREMYTPNDGGGEIILTQVACGDGAGEGFIAYTYTDEMPALFGCWTLSSNKVLIQWVDDGLMRVYQANIFKLRD